MPRTRSRDEKASSFANRLQTLIAQNGGLTRLAEKAGIGVSNLSRYLAEQSSPNLISAAAIAKAANVSLDWLANGRGTAEFSAAEPGEAVAFYDLHASAGPGLLAAHQEPPEQTIFLPIAQIRRQTGGGSTDLCALLAEGDSMEPTIRNGSLLLLDRAIAQAREGVYVILRGDDVLVKRIQPRGPRSLRLISDNERYVPEDISLDDPAVPVRLLGRVIWTGQPL